MSEPEHVIPVGVALPREMVEKIDVRRKGIPRSRYIRKALENAFASEDSRRLKQFEE